MITPEPPPEVDLPLGVERDLVSVSPASIGGAPVAYVVALSAVVAAFSFIPFSIALSAGSSFPMAQGIYALCGLILGPWAGGVASGAGALVGVLLAPHTAGLPWLTVGGAFLGAVFAASLVGGRRRRSLRVAVGAFLAAEAVLFWQHAIGHNGVHPALFLEAYAAHALAFALFLLPTRVAIERLILSPNLKRVALGLFLATWTATGMMMFTESFLGYYLLNWPEPVFRIFIGIIPAEQAARSGIGAVVGTGVIAGLRAMAVLRPRGAAY